MKSETLEDRAVPETGQQERIARPRLGFLGVGWIGRHRLQAVAEANCAEITALADVNTQALSAAQQFAPKAQTVATFEDLLAMNLDGVVIATPSAYHARQATQALEHGRAVFCQKPLARTASETRRIVEAAEANGRLLAVDYSYRHVNGVEAMRRLVRGGGLGTIFSVDLVFHNAYGPDKDWFYDPELSGGGCLIDLGTHLIDLALWILEYPEVTSLDSRLYRDGAQLGDASSTVEDYAQVAIAFAGGTSLRLACSWRISAGQDAVIEATFYGSRGAVSLRNVQGSFYDFQVEHNRGTQRQMLAVPPDAWGGRSVVNWARQLALGHGFDSSNWHLVDVARVVDWSYGR